MSKQRSITYKITRTYNLRVVQLKDGLWGIAHGSVMPVSWRHHDDAKTHVRWRRFSRGQPKRFEGRDDAVAVVKAFQAKERKRNIAKEVARD